MTGVPPADASPPDRDEAVTGFALSWVNAVIRVNFVPGRRRRARAVLEALTRRLASALEAEPFDSAAGYQVGADLVAAHISAPLALGHSLSLLNRRLLADLGITGEPARDRLDELLQQLVVGFSDTLITSAVAAAEGISRAEREVWRNRQRYLQERLQHALLHDTLTGLPNRAALLRYLDDVLAEAGDGRRVGLCTVNLQRFTAVNDTRGAHRADQLLLAVARRLRSLAASHDYFLAHLGADEFVFVVENIATTEDVTKVADQALRALPNPWRVDGHEVAVYAKAGIVAGPAAHADPAELLRAAQAALGWAKKDPGSRWQVFEPDRDDLDVRRLQLTDALPGALDRREFTLVYQPLIELGTGSVVGVEALARWHHPKYGQVGPTEFIALAEDTGQILALGPYLLEQACAQGAAWRAAGAESLLISVNVAVAQLRQPGLPAIVAATLDRTGLPARQLQLEITEGAVVDPRDGSLAALTALAGLGVRLAIDDFGTGYSNLISLSTMPVHGLKLDARFLHGVDPATPSQPAAKLLRRTIELGHDLGLTVTAEGVERPAQARLLADLGCDVGQGYGLGLPTTAEALHSLVSRT